MILVSEKKIIFFIFKIITDTCELFDYSNEKEKERKERNTAIEDSTYLILKRDTFSFLRLDNQSNIEMKNGEVLLCKIRKNKNNTYFLENPLPLNISEENSNNLNTKLWYILNSGNLKTKDNILNKNYYLNKNDIIKFGNIKYKVLEIFINSKKKVNIKEGNNETIINNIDSMDEYDISSLNKNSGDIFDFSLTPKEFYETKDENKDFKCFICGHNDCKKDNPMIRLCNCSLFHLVCLKNKINKNKKIIEKKNVINYYFKKIKCTKCNFVYPIRINIEGKIYNLFEIEKQTDCDYLIIESVENKMFFGYLKLIHFIKLNENEIKIGRNQQKNDIIICDPCVSKEHAIIKYDKEKEKILLTNISQKYGTFVLIKKSLKINENKIQIQIGKVFIEAQAMKFGDFEKSKNRQTKYPLKKKD